jgi:hypothetical protein
MTETNQNCNMENIWDIISSDNSGQFGIPGYVVPPRTVDCQKIKKNRDQLEFMEIVWKGKQLYPKPKEIFDKDGKLIPAKRPNFFEEMQKAQNFGYSKEKEDAIKEKYSSKNRSYQVDPDKIEIVKDKNKAKIYRYDRVTYFDSLIKQKKKSYEHYPHMEQIIEKAKEEIAKSPKKMMLSDELIQKYNKRGSLT